MILYTYSFYVCIHLSAYIHMWMHVYVSLCVYMYSIYCMYMLVDACVCFLVCICVYTVRTCCYLWFCRSTSASCDGPSDSVSPCDVQVAWSLFNVRNLML